MKVRATVFAAVAVIAPLVCTSAFAGDAPAPKPKDADFAAALAKSTAAVREEMKKLEFLHGRWEGEATVDRGPGGRHTIRQTENVEAKLGGALLLVQGKGFEKDAGGGERVAFEALAVLSPDAAAGPGHYRFRSWLPDGRYVDADAVLEGGKLIWSHQDGRGGTVRYTIVVGANGWHETGENVREGAPPTKFFEMTVTRSAAP